MGILMAIKYTLVHNDTQHKLELYFGSDNITAITRLRIRKEYPNYSIFYIDNTFSCPACGCMHIDPDNKDPTVFRCYRCLRQIVILTETHL